MGVRVDEAVWAVAVCQELPHEANQAVAVGELAGSSGKTSLILTLADSRTLSCPTASHQNVLGPSKP